MNKSGGYWKINAPVKDEIVRLRLSGMTFKDIGGLLKLATGTVKTHWYLARGQTNAKIPSSPYPRYDQPPELEGDALILPDAEIPFHHAEFINRVLDLAEAWKIKQMIAAGDLSMEKIAEKLGYSDVAGFYHAFKTWTGNTPANFRKRTS